MIKISSLTSKLASNLLLCIGIVYTAPALGFGSTGHRVVAEIAERHLTPEAKSAVMGITKGRPMALLATWPDEVRSDPKSACSKSWHYISIGDEESFDQYQHSKTGDVITGLRYFKQALSDKSLPENNQWRALAFFIHLTGDIHQPLHVGRREDLGGNKVEVKWFNSPSNLHKVWDNGIIESESLSYSEWVTFLDHASPIDIAKAQNTTFFDWAKESKAHRNTVYDFGEQNFFGTPKLGYDYISKNKDILHQRLLLGGLRLAGQLNGIFSAKSPTPSKLKQEPFSDCLTNF